VPRGVGKPEDDVAQRLPDRGVDVIEVRPEVGQPGGGDRREEVRRCCHHQDDLVVVRHRVHGTARREAPEEGQRPARRRHRVRRDEQVAVDHVRQTGRQPRQQEPVDRERREDEEVEQDAQVVAHDEKGDDEEQSGPDGVAEHQDPTPLPSVEEDPDEGSEDGEREEDGGERGGDGSGAGGAFGGEEDRGRQGHLEDAVRPLREQPHREEPTEAGQSQEDSEFPEEGHPRRIGAPGVRGGGRSPPVGRPNPQRPP